jgi:4-hydroxy-tetrahydrodipicolinate synthase
MYGIPQNAVNDISPSVAEEVAKRCKNVVGIKYSYPDFTKLQQFMLSGTRRSACSSGGSSV